MELHLDCKIRLSDASEFGNLYKWSLQETDENGKQIGSDQVPWQWNLWFTASELSYHRTLESVGECVLTDDGVEYEPMSVEESEQISGKLCFGVANDGEWQDATSYSMFGTSRRIKQFQLVVRKLASDDATECCVMWGCVSYTSEGADFGDETQDDVVQVSLHLSTDKFDRLARTIQARQVDLAQLYLGKVSGFYSEWSPSIVTRQVKVLVASKDQEVLGAESSEINPPRLGEVGEFSLTISNRCELQIDQDLIDSF